MDNSTFFSGTIRMKRFVLWLVPLILFLPARCPAAVLWDSFTVTRYESSGSVYSALVDVANLQWSLMVVPNGAKIIDLSSGNTIYNFTGVQPLLDGFVIPSDQSFTAPDATFAVHLLDAFQAGQLYIGLYNDSMLLDGLFARLTDTKEGPKNATLKIATPEPALLWPTALALAFLFTMRRAVSYGSRR